MHTGEPDCSIVLGFMMVMRVILMSHSLIDFLSQNEVDIGKQTMQLSKRRARLVRKLEEILCIVQSPDYMTKVPVHVRQQTDRKVSTGH